MAFFIIFLEVMKLATSGLQVNIWSFLLMLFFLSLKKTSLS